MEILIIALGFVVSLILMLLVLGIGFVAIGKIILGGTKSVVIDKAWTGDNERPS
jgi:hypothetical protein